MASTSEQSGSNPRFAEGRQYREYVDSAYAKAHEAKRKRLQETGKTPQEVERSMSFETVDKWLEPDRPQDQDCWGPWQYKKETLVLEYAPRDRHYWYEVDLERCKTSAQMLDWIFQVHSHQCERCISVEDVGHLIEALDDLLYPQNNICSCGGDKFFDTTKFLMQKGEVTQ